MMDTKTLGSLTTKRILRIKPLPREKAAIVLLRKHGYPINQIARALGRSTSFIHRCLHFNMRVGNLRRVDMRKLPHKIKLRFNRQRWQRLMRYIQVWESWILGEGEKPP